MLNRKQYHLGILAFAILRFLQPHMAAAETSRHFNVPLSPDFAYEKICVQGQSTPLHRDWLNEGFEDTGSIASAALLRDAMSFRDGTPYAPRDDAAARQIAEKLVTINFEGHHEAEFLLAKLLDDDASPPDLQRARKLSEAALAGGVLTAAVHLGRQIAFGTSKKPDPKQAEIYLKQAADNGDAAGSLYLAALYRNYPAITPFNGAADLFFQRALEIYSNKLMAGDCGALSTIARIYSDPAFGEPSPDQEMAWLKAAARAGDVAAARKIARKYETGEGVKPDLTAARTFYLMAAESGDVSSKAAYASFLLKQAPTPDETTIALELLKQAAELGDAQAMEGLGKVYLADTTNTKGLETAALWLQKAAARGSGSAAFELYQLQDKNLIAPSQTEDKHALLSKAATAGYPPAMSELADRLTCGNGFKVDLKAASSWRQQALEAGYTPLLIEQAQKSLANDTPETAEQYRQLLKRAASLGSAEAQLYLAQAYQDGLGGKVDVAEYKRFAHSALEEMSDRASAQLALARQMINGEQDGHLAEAEALLEKAVAAGEHSAEFELGRLYLKNANNAFPDKSSDAIPLLLRAANAGHIGAMLELARTQAPAEELGGLDWQKWLKTAQSRGSIDAYLLSLSISPNEASKKPTFNALATQPVCETTQKIRVAEALIENESHPDIATSLLEEVFPKYPELQDGGDLYRLAKLLRDGALGNQGFEHSGQVMIAAAIAGKPEAMRETGRMYGLGVGGLKESSDDSRIWLTKAVAAGDAKAVPALVKLTVTHYTSAERMPAMLKEIIKPLEQADQTNSLVVASALSQIFEAYHQVLPDASADRIKWLIKAASRGDPEAMLSLADAYAVGSSGLTPSSRTSTQWLRKAADAGYPKAYEPLAIAFELGFGVNQDSAAAEHWLRKAQAERTLAR